MHYHLRKISSFCALLLLLVSTACQANPNSENQALLRSIFQDTSLYVPSGDFITLHPAQKIQSQNYLEKYFKPWDGQQLKASLADIRQSELELIKGFRKKPGIGANSLEHNAYWIDQLEQNMNLPAFPNLNMKAITIRNSNVRQLPSEDTSFTAWNTERDGFPFDNLQTSFISANTPVRVLHTSRDGNWYLILTPTYYGWILGYDVAFVDSQFIAQWRDRPKLVPLQDLTIPARKISDPAVQLRIGTLYPQAGKTQDSYLIYVAVSNSNHQALLKTISVSRRWMSPFPLPIASHVAIKISNQMLGQPYGWGGLYGFRDCSATIMDLMASMGIWLPRNSADQANVGRRISLRGMTGFEKQATIMKYGLPFFTLIHMPGHIMLYIGSKDGQVYIFHDAWSFHMTAVSSLNVKLPRGGTFLDRIDSMTTLIDVTEPDQRTMTLNDR